MVTSQNEHLLELESQSDDAAIIGKTHRELLQMKLSYQQFARKHEGARMQLRRKELEIRQLQQAVDEKDKVLCL